MLDFLRNLILIFLTISIGGYILTVLKQKIMLKNNIVLIEKEAVTEKLLERADLKDFTISGKRAKSGDEVKVVKSDKNILKGILIGISQVEEALILVSYDDEIKRCNLKDISEFKIISKYGYFF